ncbi:MAG: methionine--tRNA ligase [Bdellovibrionaceae bacterium]|nr:methionine--tRNA ligase [Pseudobdellovibrionaceae bacterium]
MTQTNSKRTILVTTALPYANGPIHIGHLVEYIQADIWVRFQRLIGNDCTFLCADDTHGTPILIRARNEKRSPEAVITDMFQLHTHTFKNYLVSFDHYSSTNSQTNQHLCEEFYINMRDKNHTEVKQIEQTYCNHDQMFLPDRFVKGTCPVCKSENQYGDSCDVCGSTYSPTELKNPKCSLCGTPPVLKKSDHVFFKLNDFKTLLTEWVPQHTSNEISKKLNEWLKDDLRSWDISRDEPYFGFKIPGYDNKYFYVWVDAPIGYISTAKEFWASDPDKFARIWKQDQSEVYHFIGKDIVYFHCLFWPAMLTAAGYRKPTQVNVHGFLTVNGEKMSKSKGTFIEADHFYKFVDPTFLRYYYACKSSAGLDDIDLNLEDFVQRVNSDLVGKYVNLGSRSAQLLHKYTSGKMSEVISEEGLNLLLDVVKASHELQKHYEAREYAKAIQLIRSHVDHINQYFDQKSPWKTLKENPNSADALESLAVALNAFRIFTIYLSPIIPTVSDKVAALFNETAYQWPMVPAHVDAPWLKSSYFYKGALTLNPFQHLIQRLDIKNVTQVLQP